MDHLPPQPQALPANNRPANNQPATNGMPKNRVAQNFGQASHHYDAQANLQGLVAHRLAQAILATQPPRGQIVLEIGGGTGGLTQRLLPALQPCTYLFSDLSWPMVTRARLKRLTPPFDLSPPHIPPSQISLPDFKSGIGDGIGDGNVHWMVMDGELPALPAASVDLVVSSLAVQWFVDPAHSLPSLLRLLKPGGQLWFSTLVQGSFDQWRRDCLRASLPIGLIPLLPIDGLLAMLQHGGAAVAGGVEAINIAYPSALAFLQNLRAIGAHHPAPDHQPVNAGRLRQLLTTLPTPYLVDYHVWIGCVTV